MKRMPRRARNFTDFGIAPPCNLDPETCGKAVGVGGTNLCTSKRAGEITIKFAASNEGETHTLKKCPNTPEGD